MRAMPIDVFGAVNLSWMLTSWILNALSHTNESSLYGEDSVHSQPMADVHGWSVHSQGLRGRCSAFPTPVIKFLKGRLMSNVHALHAPASPAARPPEPISRLQVPKVQDLPKPLQEVYAGLQKKDGFVPNFVEALAINPASLQHLLTFYESLYGAKDSLLTDAERELVAVVSSEATGCSYCVIYHRAALADAIDDAATADRIARNYQDVALKPRERAIADAAYQLAKNPHSLGEADFARLREHGLSDAAILEVLEVAAFHAYANRLTIALNVLPDAQHLQGGRASEPKQASAH